MSKRVIQRNKQNKSPAQNILFDYKNLWSYPKLLKYIENATITKITGIYVSSNEFGEYVNDSADNKLLIGYSIDINIGLYSTKLLCIHRFLKKWETSNNFNRLLNSYMNKSPRVCIISCHSKSWGKKKQAHAMPIFLDWIRSSKKILLSMGIKIATAPTIYIK